MKINYLNVKLREPMKKYQRLLIQYNNKQLNNAQTKELVKLSSLLISELVNDSNKTKKVSMMDGDALRLLANKNS